MISSVVSDRTPDRKATKRFAPLLTSFFEANKTWFRKLRTGVRPTTSSSGITVFLTQAKGRRQTGDIQADVDVGVCVIRGALTGNVNARSRVEIYKTARVQGDISTPVLLVEEGAMLSGAITMGKAAARQPDAIRLDGNEELRKSQGAS